MLLLPVGFNQQWSVEEERPIGGGPSPGSSPPADGGGETVTGPRPEEPARPTDPGTTTAYIDDADDDWADGSQPNPAV